jgi:enoyl-CoA hydratase
MQLYGLFPRLHKPVVVGVRGHAFAGGCGLALSGDYVIAGQGASFGYPETSRGFVPALVSIQLQRLVGPRIALDLLLSGRIVPSAEALQLGLVSRVVPDVELEAVAHSLALSLAGVDPTAIQLTRELYYRTRDLSFGDALEAARDINILMRYTDAFIQGASEFGRRSGSD